VLHLGDKCKEHYRIIEIDLYLGTNSIFPVNRIKTTLWEELTPFLRISALARKGVHPEDDILCYHSGGREDQALLSSILNWTSPLVPSPVMSGQRAWGSHSLSSAERGSCQDSENKQAGEGDSCTAKCRARECQDRKMRAASEEHSPSIERRASVVRTAK
jgi:hypothetical protein